MMVEVINGMSHVCCRVRVILILTEVGDCSKVDALVVHDKPLGHDLLIGIDTMHELGGIVIRPTREVQLGRNYIQLLQLWNRTSVLFLTMRRKRGQ